MSKEAKREAIKEKIKEEKKQRKFKTSRVITKKKLAIATVIIMLIALFGATLLTYKEKSISQYANPELLKAISYGEFTEEDAKTESDYVEFGAFFLRDLNGDGIAERVKGTCKETRSEDTLYMELKVLLDGYLKDGKIEIDGKNFYLQTALPKDNEIKENVIGNNIKEIELNQITNGTQKLITGIVRSGDYSFFEREISALDNKISNYSTINKIVLTGTHVASDGTETEINKEVELNLDWYGRVKAEIPEKMVSDNLHQTNNIQDAIDENNGNFVLNFSIGMKETLKQLFLKSANITAEIPILNGYNPTKVEVIGYDIDYSYDEETRMLNIKRETNINLDGRLGLSCYDSAIAGERYNEFCIEVTYPLEAYTNAEAETLELRIPVTGYYEGYNNTNEEFSNPYKSNVANAVFVIMYENPKGTVANVKATVGRTNFSGEYIVSKKNPYKIYNGIEEPDEDLYTVSWQFYTGAEEESAGRITMAETEIDSDNKISDVFIKTNNQEDSMEDITTNVGIYFSGATNIFGDEGEIKVYNDETSELIVTFTKKEWEKYVIGNPYKFETPIKHIRIETSEAEKNKTFYVYFKKTLDDEYITDEYTKEEFESLKYIKTSLVGYINGTYLSKVSAKAIYETPYSVSAMQIGQTTLSTQETIHDLQIKISTPAYEELDKMKWKNGVFLIKLPKEILDIDLSRIECDNPLVKIINYEVYEDDNIFIKINTANNEPDIFELMLTCDITPDPRISTTNKKIEMYYINNNENSVTYYKTAKDIYDVNGNLNLEEKVGITDVTIGLVSPNSLLTNETATNYNDKDSLTVAPKLADLSKEIREATVNIELKNNYSSTISEVTVLGRVPFEGNRYTIMGSKMGSTYTATMQNSGITIPEELMEDTTVYYSKNGQATIDLNDEENGWTTEPDNYEDIKSYMVSFGNYVFSKGQRVTISYDINVPDGLNYNDVAYSHHAVYFCLDTEGGKYRTYVEPNKVGFVIAKQFDLEVVKYQKDKEILVPQAIYSVFEEGDNSSRSRTTGENGSLELNGLYIDRIYVLKELLSPDEYALNEEEIKFRATESETGIAVTLIDGNPKSISAIQASVGEDYKVKIEVEDEIKANLKIKKIEENTETPIRGVKFKLKGKGLSDSGKIFVTDAEGNAQISGIEIGEEYTLEEIKASGYYLSDVVRFKLENNNGIYNEDIIDGTVKQSSVTTEDDKPTIVLEIENEKIPSFDLQIIKTKKKVDVSSEEEIEENVLEGAKFELYKNSKRLGVYTSDENGAINISGLYQYIPEKNIDQTYRLKEIKSPDGFVKTKDIIFKVIKTDSGLVFEEITEDGQEKKQYSINGNIVKLVVPDMPVFKLIKKDTESGEVLSGVKFAIYNVDSGESPARNCKGEILGTKETINNKEYYTFTTDENGEIIADFEEGFYKAVEVYAPNGYDFENKEVRFGVGKSNVADIGFEAQWGKVIAGSQNDDEEVRYIFKTEDGGYVAIGMTENPTVPLQDGIYLQSGSGDDIFLIKYNSEDDIEWTKIVGDYSGWDTLHSAQIDSNGNICVFCNIYGNGYDFGNGFSFPTSSNAGSTYLVRYNEDGIVQSACRMNLSSSTAFGLTSDGGFCVSGSVSASSQFNFGNGVTINNTLSNPVGFIVKYNRNGVAQWVRTYESANIRSIVQSTDNKLLITGSTTAETLDFGNGITVASKGSSDAIMFKIDLNGNTEWGKNVGGSSSESFEKVIETSDNNYIVLGSFYSTSIDFGNNVVINKTSNPGAIVCKYDQNGNIIWARLLGESGYYSFNYVYETSDGDYIVPFGKNNTIYVLDKSGNSKIEHAIESTSSLYILAISEKDKGVYLIGGYFYSSNALPRQVDFGDGVVLGKTRYDACGYIVEYNQVEKTSIRANNEKQIDLNITINQMKKTSDGGCICVGEYNGTDVYIGDGWTVSSANSYNDGIVIKYDYDNKIEWVRTIKAYNRDTALCVTETSDGDFLVTGRSWNSDVDLGNNKRINNNYGGNIIIKYSPRGEVIFGKCIRGLYSDNTKVIETSDNGYVVIGDFSGGTYLDNDMYISCNGNTDGIIVKYNSNGTFEWAKAIGGTGNEYLNSIVELSNHEYVVVGSLTSNSINFGNGITINTTETATNGMIFKLNANGDVLNATVHRSGSSQGNYYNYDNNVISVNVTNDGGYVVGGTFKGQELYFNYNLILYNKTTNNTYAADAYIAKFSENDELEWIRQIGSSGDEQLKYLYSLENGEIIVTGTFTKSLYVGKGQGLTAKGSIDAFIIKYDINGDMKWAHAINGIGNENILDVAQLENEKVGVLGLFGGDSAWLDKDNNILKSNGNIFIAELSEKPYADNISELVVENELKTYKITTDIEEINGVKGGSISGEDRNPYELVLYGHGNNNEIKITPDENYEIISITVNGEDYPYQPEDDDSYTMPQFDSVTEDKHIVAKFALKDNKITINKVDKYTREGIKGVTFELKQLEERTDPTDVIGDLVNYGVTRDAIDKSTSIEGMVGNKFDNGSYWFVEKNGYYVPTNGKTYRASVGYSGGVKNTTANSYFTIDLTDKTGNYYVSFKARASSESSGDVGYALVTDSTSTPTSITNALSLSGERSEKTYFIKMTGGQIYYLHFMYRKNSNNLDSYEDQVVFRDIRVHGERSVTLGFENIDSQLISNNTLIDGSVARAYIPIDLTGKSGKYNLIINAEVSSEGSNDYGMAKITQDTNAPSTVVTGRVFYIYGNSEARDYTYVLEGNQKYYLHLVYQKSASTSKGADAIIINSINVRVNSSELVTREVTSNNDGKAITQVPFGKYQLTETNTPDGYIPLEGSEIIEFRSYNGAQHEFTVENIKYSKVIVHYYIKGTEEKLADDIVLIGREGEKYSTEFYINIDEYELEKDENDNYVLPNNLRGTFTNGIQEVIYYYSKKPIPLVVHHYIEGTLTPVPLANGDYAGEVIESGEEGTNYSTSAISSDELNDKYILKAIPQNAEGIYEYPNVEVTYYYSVKRFNIETSVQAHEEIDILGQVTIEKGGTISGEYEDIYENVEYGEDSKKEIKAIPDYGYEIKSILINGNPIDFVPNSDGSVILNKFMDVTEDKDVIVEFQRLQGRVIVHHYLENTVKRIMSKDGGTIEDEIKQGSIGALYATKVSDDAHKMYEFVRTEGDVSGEIEEEDKEVIYYYRIRNIDFIIDKIDSVSRVGLENARFRVEQIETREEPENALSEMNQYNLVEDDTFNYSVYQYDQYYYTLVNDQYLATNSGRYCSIATNGVSANSYIKIDGISSGTYKVIVNAEISSEQDGDYGWATLDQTATTSSTNAKFINISGEVEAANYESTEFEYDADGDPYYINFGYAKNESVVSGKDTFAINSVKLVNVNTNERIDIISRMSRMSRNSLHYFEKYKNQYVSTSSRGFTDGAAHGLFVITPSRSGKYLVVVNAESRINGSDYAYASFMDNGPSYDEEGHFMKISGTTEAKDYQSGMLDYEINGSSLYLVLGYTKNLLGDAYDGVAINSIKLYRVVTPSVSNKVGAVYTSQNKNIASSTSYATIPIDLREYVGKYKVTINAEVSSEVGKDFGYAVISDSEAIIDPLDSLPFMYISGEQSAQDYIELLQGGKLYYLHLGYKKDGSGDSGLDRLVVNTVDISTSDMDLYSGEVTTNENGQAIINVPYGTYRITEIDTPNGYKPLEEPIEINLLELEEPAFTIENEKKAKVTVHHYFKNTEDQVADDEEIIGSIGDNYTTNPHIDLERYEIEKDENGEDILPSNKDDVMTYEDIEVTYYYVKKKGTVTVKHLIDGTENNITLIDGTEVEPIVTEDYIEEIYRTEPIPDGRYKLVTTPGNSTGEYVIGNTDVIYYYILNEQNYRVEYYYNGDIDNSKTDVFNAVYGDEITEYVDKVEDGYLFESVDEIPLTIKDTEEENVIKVYYLPIRNLTVQHIDKNTGEVIVAEEKHGKEGYTVTTSAIDIDDYMLVESPDIEEYTYSEDDQIVKYYYAKVSSGVLEKHLDLITGRPIASDEYQDGYEGKHYETSPKEIEGYRITTNKELYESIVKEDPEFLSNAGYESLIDFFEDNGIIATDEYIPEDAEGEMEEELITVRYYYTPIMKLIVKYKDILTGEEIPETIEGEQVDSTVVKEGYLNETYKAEAKTFENYLIVSNKTYYKWYFTNHPEELEAAGVETVEEYLEQENIDPTAPYEPRNSEGIYEVTLNDDETYSTEILVTYYYGPEREVIVRYYDKNTGEEITTETIKVGPDGDEYDVSDTEKEIEGYTLVEEPENPEGIYQENNNPRSFYYAKNTQVIVKYVDKDTGESIDEAENYEIDGYEGKQYETEQKEFGNYEYEEVVGETEGAMPRDPIQVIYYYSRTSTPVNNTVTNDISNNTVTNEVVNNTITNDINNNTVTNEVINNIITNDINNNTVTNEVVNNTITNDINNNTVTNEVVNNTVVNNTVNNTANTIKITNITTNTTKNTNTTNSIINRIINPKTGDIVPIVAYSTIFIVLFANLMLARYKRVEPESVIRESRISKISTEKNHESAKHDVKKEWIETRKGKRSK